MLHVIIDTWEWLLSGCGNKYWAVLCKRSNVCQYSSLGDGCSFTLW